MVVIRAVVVAFAAAVLLGVGGGYFATALHRVAPGYYPAVFPLAGPGEHAAHAGAWEGTVQGAVLGAAVGGAVALGLGWLGRLRWSTGGRAAAVIAGCAAVGAVGGGLVGLAVGWLVPEYYGGGRRPGISPTDVGLGLGASQGVVGGVIGGGVLVLASAWWRSRVAIVPRA
jgi:hypothetical protein